MRGPQGASPISNVTIPSLDCMHAINQDTTLQGNNLDPLDESLAMNDDKKRKRTDLPTSTTTTLMAIDSGDQLHEPIPTFIANIFEEMVGLDYQAWQQL